MSEPAVATTPLMRQYWQIRQQVSDPDTILFFRLGDFYEMFFDDAVAAAPILDIALTTRNRNDPNPTPLCGIPYHSADSYIARLIDAGKKVAICEQVEDPKTAKGIVRREIVRLITPGSVMAPESLPAREPNFLAALWQAPNGHYGLAVIDITIGSFQATSLASRQAVQDELARLTPRELLVPQSLAPLPFQPTCLTVLPNEQWEVATLPTLAGLDALQAAHPASVPAVAAIWQYLRYTKLAGPELHTLIAEIRSYAPTDYLVLDEAAQRNLELTHASTGSRHGSLLWHLDRTATAMGARTLKQWLSYPLRHRTSILARQQAVSTLVTDVDLRQRIGATLQGVADLERLAARIATGLAHARDCVSLRHSLETLPAIADCLQPHSGLLATLGTRLDPCADLVEEIARLLVDEPPLALTDGGLIRSGVDPELDELRALQQEGKGFLARLETQERARTGIHSLKIRYNRVFGYYLEITHAHADKVPADYIRKQTLTNAERYITPELKTYEEKVVTAAERADARELEHFHRLRQQLAGHVARIKQSAQVIGELDALLSLAIVAAEGNYVVPTIAETPDLAIVAGRHPVIERLRTDEPFVPNDCAFDADTRFLMITGPNMAGKSTIMRQVALIVILAQMGSLVPARSAAIGLTDRIFTRVGASDHLIRGQSTFMVEMAEMAVILQAATAESLIVIDELGRGTSTYDGISIAWAVAEELHDRIGARTLFATHYHELGDLAAEKPHIRNMAMAVKEWNDQIIFLRTLQPGRADRSYGIEVARLAGLPAAVTTRARALLKEMEHDARHHQQTAPSSDQLPLFVPEKNLQSQQIRERLQTLDPDHLTPMQALQMMMELRTLI